MSRRGWIILSVVLALALVGALVFWLGAPRRAAVQPSLAVSETRVVDHTDLFAKAGITQYEGAKSCVGCHEDDVKEVLHSYHYLEYNPVSDIAGKGEIPFGGRYAYNDFCGNIFWEGKVAINFIGKAVLQKAPEGKEDLVGTFIASGCSMCHGVSMGKVPEPVESEEEYANIDCLACHTDALPTGGAAVKKGFKAVVGSPEEGFRYVPGENFDFAKVAQRITSRPTNANCLGCHAFSGGGPGFKRPNLDPSLMGPEVPEEVDVHIARGMQCVDCHTGKDHKFGSLVVDTWSRESEDIPTCESCHQVRHTEPVIGWLLETFHTEKVACQTCHIPTFAKGGYPTDMVRHWDEVEFSEKMARWEPVLEMAENVEPVYAWWDEKTREAYTYEPITPENGVITLAKPVGDKQTGKIYPFKYHQAIVPFDSVNKLPIPVKVGVVFATGDLQKAYQAGAQPGNLQVTGDFVTLERYMGINHGVVPAEQALGCFNCHGFTEERMPWRQLGYGIYPPVAFTFFTVVLPLLLIGLVVYAVRRNAQKA